MRWKDTLLDLRDIIIEKIEDILTGFYHSARESWDPGKMLLFGIVGIIAVVMIISNLLSGDKQPEPPKEPKQAVEEQKEPEQSEQKEPTAADAVEATTVAERFLKEFNTFHGANLGDRLERMEPLITKELYEEMAKNKVAFGVEESKFISIDSRFIEPLDDGLYWSGEVTIEMDGKKDKDFWYVTLENQDGWKVAAFDAQEDN